MLILPGKCIFIANQTEFHVKDGVCVSVCHQGAFWGREAAFGWRLVGVMGPPRRKGKDEVLLGDCLIFARRGEVFYTPPIEEIQRYKKTPKVAPPKEKTKERASKKIRGEHQERALHAYDAARGADLDL